MNIVSKIGDIINPLTQSILRSDSLTSPSRKKPNIKQLRFIGSHYHYIPLLAKRNYRKF